MRATLPPSLAIACDMLRKTGTEKNLNRFVETETRFHCVRARTNKQNAAQGDR